MDNKLNVQKLGYEVGEPMWVHWDDRYVVFKVRTGKGYWRGSKYLYVCNNNTIYLLGSDAGIHHVTEELPSNLEAKVREYKP